MKLKLEYLLIFLVSSIVIINQVCLIQIFAYQQYYHFASIIISLALVGFGLSGFIIKSFLPYINYNLENFTLLTLETTALIIPFSFVIDQNVIGGFDSFLIFYDSVQLLKFFLTAFTYCLQFTSLAILIGLLFYVYFESINKMYFCNLIGSAFGGLIVIQLLWYLNPEEIYSLTGLLISGLILIYILYNRIKMNAAHFILLALPLVFFSFTYFQKNELKISQFKSIYRTLNYLGTRKIQELKSPYGRIEIIESQALRTSPGLSLSSFDNIPSGKEIFVNGDSYGLILESNKTDELEFLKHSTLYLPYQIKQNAKVLILNSSGNLEIFRSLVGNAKKIYVTEINPVVKEIINKSIDSSHIDKLTLIQSDPRNFIESTSEKFDIIFYPVVQSSGFYSGLYSLQETYFLTQESFQKYLDRLKEEGFLTISTHFDYPLRSSARLINLFTNLINSEKKQSELQLVVINNWNTITCLLKKGNFTEEDLDEINKFCENNQFDILTFPDSTNLRRNHFHKIFDSLDLDAIDNIYSNNKEFTKEYPFKIDPPDDNQPYFFNFIRLNLIHHYLTNISLQKLTYFELGYFIYMIIYSVVIVILILIITLTFVKIKISKRLKFNTFLYFSTIGFSYMLIELSLIQRNVLYLSSDIYSITFVISLLLFSTGIGSLIATSAKLSNQKILKIFLVISFVIILILSIYSQILEPALISKSYLKYLILGGIILLIGIVLGFLFPVGITYFSKEDKNIVPLAWAANGSFSVLGSMSAVILNMNFGFKFTLASSAILYFVFGLIFYSVITRKN